MRFNKITVGTCVALILTLGLAPGSPHVGAFGQSAQTAGTVSVAVGPQYDTTHVYMAPQDFDLGIDGLWLSHRQQIGQRVLGIHLTDLGGAGADEQLRLRLVDRRHQCGRHTAHHEHGQSAGYAQAW